MKKLLILLTALVFSMATLTQANASAFGVLQQHLTKSGKPDRRFKENKPPLRKDGKPDMRYKASQPAKHTPIAKPAGAVKQPLTSKLTAKPPVTTKPSPAKPVNATKPASAKLVTKPVTATKSVAKKK